MRAYYGRAGSSAPAKTANLALWRGCRLSIPDMRKLLQTLLIVTALAVAAGCVYVAPISQGNVLDQEDIDQVEAGMTRSQVRFLLGTPMIDDPFHADRWDYVYYQKVGRGDASYKRWIAVLFENDRVSSIIKDQTLNPDL